MSLCHLSAVIIKESLRNLVRSTLIIHNFDDFNFEKYSMNEVIILNYKRKFSFSFS